MIEIKNTKPEIVKTPEEIKAEELRAEESKKLLARLVKPHTKVSREVTETDIDKVVEESKTLYRLCYERNGLYSGAYAMHHSQIDDQDPLSFYVTADRSIIINPKIIRHSNYTKDSKEQCMSFPDKEPIIVQRWQKLELEYQTVMTDPNDEKKIKLSNKIVEGMSGFSALVAQHETDHSNGKLIYQLN